MKRFTVAFAGNPNTGKTTLFNSFTGTHQQVGNYPGVTVEKRSGIVKQGEFEIEYVDLPGCYSLAGYSEDEMVARRFLLDESPKLVINVVDASNLERNLFLTTQLAEMGMPAVVALNMNDIAHSRGIQIDCQTLSNLLGVPVIETVARKGAGIANLLKTVIHSLESPAVLRSPYAHYSSEVRGQLAELSSRMSVIDRPELAKGKDEWIALRLLEGDLTLRKEIENDELLQWVDKGREQLRTMLGMSPEEAVDASRFGFTSGLMEESVKRDSNVAHHISDSVDRVLLHPRLGLFLFLCFMYTLFHVTFTAGAPLAEWVEELIAGIGNLVESVWPDGKAELLRSLIVDGVIAGVGGVLVFLPNIILLFAGIAILEDSGYMARAAFLMDRYMHKIGLHGKSFIPMLLGFGCNVAAIMATRTLENKKDRILTIMILPMMSCSARLPVYALIIPAFFAVQWQGAVMTGVYLFGIFLAIAVAKLLRLSVMKGEADPFVMELPPYHMPTLRSIALHSWDKTKHFLVKAGTLILMVSIVLWALTTYPRTEEETPIDVANEQSYAGQIGSFLEPVMSPLGFDRKMSTALVGALAAKEVFVAQMGIAFAVEDAEAEAGALKTQLRETYTPLTGLSLMIFLLVAAPCVATFAATKAETSSVGLAAAQWIGFTALGYILSLLIYSVGSFAGLGV